MWAVTVRAARIWPALACISLAQQLTVGALRVMGIHREGISALQHAAQHVGGKEAASARGKTGGSKYHHQHGDEKKNGVINERVMV